jgi:hypothetical protein
MLLLLLFNFASMPAQQNPECVVDVVELALDILMMLIIFKKTLNPKRLLFRK